MLTNSNIRTWSKSDFSAIMRIGRESFSSTFINKANQEEVLEYINETYSLEKMLSDFNNDLKYYVLEENSEILGFILLRKLSPSVTESDSYSKVERLYLDPKMKGKGYGGTLLTFAEDLFKQQNATYIWLEVLRKNEGAVRFYKKMGYSQFGESPAKFKSDYDIDLWMRKKLT